MIKSYKKTRFFEVSVDYQSYTMTYLFQLHFSPSSYKGHGRFTSHGRFVPPYPGVFNSLECICKILLVTHDSFKLLCEHA